MTERKPKEVRRTGSAGRTPSQSDPTLAAGLGGLLTPSSALQLQRKAGNTVVARLIAEGRHPAFCGWTPHDRATVQRKKGYTDAERATSNQGVKILPVPATRFGVLGDAFLFYNFPIGKADADIRDSRATRIILAAIRRSIYAKRQPTTVDPTGKNEWSHGKRNPDEAPVVGQIKVAGFTDRMDFSSGARERGRSNYQLRIERASNIKTYLEAGFQSRDEGMGPVSIIRELPAENWYLFKGDSPRERAQNRAVLVWILPQAKAQKPVSRGECDSIAVEIKRRAFRDNDRTGVFTANIMKMACYGGYDGGFLAQDPIRVYIAAEARKRRPEPIGQPSRDAFREINDIILANRADKETTYRKIRGVTDDIMEGYQEVGRYVSVYTGHDYRGGWFKRLVTGERTHALPPHIRQLALWIDARVKSSSSVYHAFSKDK